MRAARIVLLAALCGVASPVLAHPHIWVEATAELVFDAQGRPVAIKHNWLFDQGYSAWAIQGLDTDGDGSVSSGELQPLADDNMRGLAEYGFFTFGSLDGAEVNFTGPADPYMTYDGDGLRLQFELAISPAMTIGDEFEVEVGDPEYYAAFSFQGPESVSLSGAPEDCVVDAHAPRPIAPELEAQLFSLPPDVTELPPELKAAARELANVLVVTCGGAAPATALEAVGAEAQNRGTPFVAPPPETSGPVPRTGFLGWIATQQQAFYQSLTDALASLRTGANAFWTLGILSFLYGVFHAAGPGHGKLVISSYVLAREQEVRRGVLLSFAAALVQSLTAIVFILFLAGILGLSSFALSDAARWLELTSYALIALVGAWLVWRKLRAVLGRGGHHHDSHGHHEDHQHVVTPSDARGSWREALGVVLAVGIRPCSGALIVLAFALSQGVLLAGIAATLLMGVGTGLTVSVLAGFAVFFKDLAARTARRGRSIWTRLISFGELAAAVVVFAFGAILFAATV